MRIGLPRLIVLLIALLLAGCGKTAQPHGEPRKQGVPLETLNALWTYLEDYRESSTLPAASEIAKRFGDSQEITEESYRTDSRLPPEENEYFRYSAEDKAQPSLAGKTYRFRYQADDMPWLDVRTRKSDGAVVGWEWAWIDRPTGNGIGPPGSEARRTRVADTKSLWAYLQGFRNTPEMPSMDEVKRRFGEPNERCGDGEHENPLDAFYQATPTQYYRFPAKPWAEGATMPAMSWYYRHKGDIYRAVVIRTRVHYGSIIGWSWWDECVPAEQRTAGPDE